MRNWNSKRRPWIRKGSMYPAYLWGIETQSGAGIVAPGGPRIQPTYEELKRIPLEVAYLGVILYPAYLWGIETSNGGFFNTQPRHVSSLPMRNWNPLTFKSVEWRKFVSSLPMRNWNTKGRFRWLWSPLVSSLPMRNWNCYNAHQIWRRPLRIQPTYEELKLI